MKMKRENITPARARELLSKNIINRPVRQSNVDYLASEIVNGRWLCTHQGIALTPGGELTDGQHRLLACIQANMPIDVMVDWDSSRAIQDVSDVGSKRTLGDQFHLSDGMVNANVTTAAVRCIASICCSGSSIRLSVPAARDIHAVYGRDIAAVLGSVRACKPLIKSWIIGSLAFALHADRRASGFIDRFGDGEGLKRGDPAKAARDWVLNANGFAGSLNYRGGSIEALLNSVYNAIHNNEVCQIKRGVRGLEYFLGRERKNVTTLREQFKQQL